MLLALFSSRPQVRYLRHAAVPRGPLQALVRSAPPRRGPSRKNPFQVGIGVEGGVIERLDGKMEDEWRLGPIVEQQLDAVTRLPKAKQKVVAELIDSVIVKAQMEAQHATG